MVGECGKRLPITDHAYPVSGGMDILVRAVSQRRLAYTGKKNARATTIATTKWVRMSLKHLLQSLLWRDGRNRRIGEIANIAGNDMLRAGVPGSGNLHGVLKVGHGKR